MHPPCSRLMKLRVLILLSLAAFPSVAFNQIIGFFPTADSISVVGSCTPPSLTCHVINVVGGVDTIDIQPMWDDRMYAGAPFSVQIAHCFFVVVDFSNANQYQLHLTSLWPDSGTSQIINFDSTFSMIGRLSLRLRVTSGGGIVDSAEQRFFADAVGAVEPTRFGLPSATRLLPNFPNPFNGSTIIRYQLERGSNVTLAVFNMLGQQVASLVSQNMPPGSHTTGFDATDLSSGVYLCRLQAGDFIQVHKMISLR
jgi:hypothetical protein